MKAKELWVLEKELWVLEKELWVLEKETFKRDTLKKEPFKRALLTRGPRQGAAGARCGVRLWGAGEGVTVRV